MGATFFTGSQIRHKSGRNKIFSSASEVLSLPIKAMKRLQKSPTIRFSLTRILGVLFFAGLAATASAQTTYVKADNTNFLNTAASYTANSGVPGPADAILIDGTLTAARTANLGGSLSINALNVSTSYAQRFAFGSTAGATLTIGAGGINKTNTSVAMNLSCSVALGANNETWNIAGNNLVFNGPAPVITDNGYNLTVTGGGTFDLRPTNTFTCGTNITIKCYQVNINSVTADVVLGGANTFTNLLIAAGTVEGSSFPTDTGGATTSNFGNAGSGTITFGAGTATSGTLIYNGNTAATPKTFTMTATGTNVPTIQVSTPGQTLTVTNLLYASGTSQTIDRSWYFGGAGNLRIMGKITNSGSATYKIGIVKNDTGTLTLGNTNTYAGISLVNGGTLALTGNGSLSNTPLISLAGGATLDVSGKSSPFVLQSGQSISNSSITTAYLKGSINASQGSIAMSVNGSGPAFTIGSGTLTLSSSTVLQINSSIAVPGTYPLIIPAAGGSVTGTVPPITLYRSTGHLVISGGELDLVVESSDLLNYYVSPAGSDVSGDGTLGNPWQSIGMARDTLQNLNSQNGDIHVYLRGGRYFITNTIAFTTADSGMNGYYINYQSYPGETAIIDGGKQVTGWTQVPGQPYWVANVPTSAGFADYFRQLYVNGVRAERARSDWINGTAYVWTNGASFNYSTANTGLTNVYGIAFALNSGLKNYSNVTDLRLLCVKNFKEDEFPILSIITNSGNIDVQLQQPYCQYLYDNSSSGFYFNATRQWMVVNAFEELDEPGEWYLNRATHQVYYYPSSFEDMTTVVVYAPVVETLVAIGGDSTASKVQNLRFQGLTFEHGNWFFPRDYFLGGAAAEALLHTSASGGVYYTTEVPGVILMTNTLGIQFIGNTIKHQGACGIQLYAGARDTLIQGNLFCDLTGAAVLQYHSYGAAEIPTNTIVADNVMRNSGMDFMAATLVDNMGGYGFQVVRNDLADSQYDGFVAGNGIASLAANNGQGATLVASNRVAMAMEGARYDVQDGGSIYTSGVWPPNSYFIGNDVYDINQPNTNLWTFGFYQDEGSYGLTWSNNVIRDVIAGIKGGNWQRADGAEWPNNSAISNYTDATVYNSQGLTLFKGYVTFTNGAMSAAALVIVQAAGVGPGYTNLLSHIYSGTNLARGKFTWASSSNAISQAAADWNYNSAWHSAATDTNSWWAVDLGAPYVIQRLELVPRTDLDEPDARCNFQVQAANNTNFTSYTVLAEQSSVPFAYKTTNLRNSWIKYLNNPGGYRYLRVKKTSGATLGFAEFQAYGYASTVPTTPTNLYYNVSNKTLTISWPSNYLGWVLQVQTNSLTAGLTTNWITIPASAAITMTNVPLGGTNPSVFYRLMYQP